MTPQNPRVLIPAAQIQQRIQSLAAEINRDYPEGTLYVVAILNGAFIFLSALVRAPGRNVRIDFSGISSYGKGKTTSGQVKLTKDLDMPVEGADLLIVEDIVDSG